MTGGTAGIGLACVTELLRASAKVCVTGLAADAGKLEPLLSSAGIKTQGSLLEMSGTTFTTHNHVCLTTFTMSTTFA